MKKMKPLVEVDKVLLAVLKLFGKGNPEAYNSFPLKATRLLLDF